MLHANGILLLVVQHFESVENRGMCRQCVEILVIEHYFTSDVFSPYRELCGGCSDNCATDGGGLWGLKRYCVKVLFI